MKDSDKTHYLTDFLSTTSSLALASGYAWSPKGENEYYNILVFIVHPECQYAGVKNYSFYPKEQEITLSPFNRYLFMEEKLLQEDELAEYIKSDPSNGKLYDNYSTIYMERGVILGYFLVLPADFDSELNANDLKRILKRNKPFGNLEQDHVVLTKNRTSKESELINHFKKFI